MTRKALVRGSLFLLLLGLAVLLMVWFGSLGATPHPDSWHLAGGDELATDYGGTVGQRVEIYGHVVSTDPVVIEGTYSGEDLRLTVDEVERDVSVGEYLHVYGVVEPGHSIGAIGTVVYPENGILFTYAVSVVAALWTLGRFLNRWRFDGGSMAFVRRNRRLVARPGRLVGLCEGEE